MKTTYKLLFSLALTFASVIAPSLQGRAGGGSALAQSVGEAFYIYRNDGGFNAFFREEIDSIAYSCYDADSTLYDDAVMQVVYTKDSIYQIPLAAIDSIAFGVNRLTVSEAYVPVEEDGYVVEDADTLNGIYQLRFLGTIPQLHVDDIISVVTDTMAVQVRISSLNYSSGNRVRITSERAKISDIFTDGTFTLSSENQTAEVKANVYYPVEIIYFDEMNMPRRIRRSETNFTQNLYHHTIDYSGTDLHKTDHTRLYLESCRFDFNLDLVVTCNFSSKGEAADKFRRGELQLQKSVIRGSIDTDFMLRFDVSGKKSEKIDEIMLKRNLHKPFYAKFIVAGVPILVEMTTHLLTDGNYEAEGSFSAYAGFATNNTAELGFSWSQASGLKPYASYNSSFELHKPTIEGKAHLAAKASVFPRITFSLYGLVGPSFDIKPYLRETFDLGFYDQMGSNKEDFYGAECDVFAGYDAAVGLSFLSSLGKKPFVKSPSWNVVDKMILESPKEVKFEKAEPEQLTVGKAMKVSFKATEYIYIFNRSQNVELPFVVKFETNCGTLSSDFALVDVTTGLATVEWTPSSSTIDGKDAYIVAMMHDANGRVKTADRWTPKKPDNLCPDDHHPHMIDLGIGTLWSCCNVGASAPEQYGNYYAWGETSPKSVYNEVTYSYFTGQDTDGDGWIDKNFSVVNIGSDISGTSYDAARANWGAPWRMPTLAECQALANCSSEWTTLNGVYGRKFTGSNGGSIFLPAAGYRWDGELSDAGAWGYYWSSTLYESDPYGAHYFYFGSGSTYWGGWYYRFDGRTVRPVR